MNKGDGTNLVSGSPACVVVGADTCDFRVRVYDASSGGNLLFEEEHTNLEIGDYNGIFNLSINSICASTLSGGVDWGTGGCISNGCVDFSSTNVYFEISFHLQEILHTQKHLQENKLARHQAHIMLKERGVLVI